MTRPKVHILLGNPEDYLYMLIEWAAGIRPDNSWTINKKAHTGDYAVFYLIQPLSCFFAVGSVTSDAWLEENPSSEWYGYYMADIADVRLLSRPVSLDEARDRFPQWGWLRQPRRSVCVPDRFAKKFLESICANL